jgi:hypothetical protein
MSAMLCSLSMLAAIATASWPEDFGPNSPAWQNPLQEPFQRDWTTASPQDRIRMRLEGQVPPECADGKKTASEGCC